MAKPKSFSPKDMPIEAPQIFGEKKTISATGRSTSTRLRLLGAATESTLKENLDAAASKGNLPLIQALVAVSDPEDLAKSNALLCSAGQNHIDCARFLLSVCNPSMSNNLALCIAAELGSVELIEILLPVSRIVNQPYFGATALEHAADNGHLECVKLLSRVYDPRSNQSFALALAAGAGHADCLDFLIPLSDPAANFSTAISMAIDDGNAQCVDLLMPFLLALPAQAIADAAHESGKRGRRKASERLGLLARSVAEAHLLDECSAAPILGAKNPPPRL